MSLFKPLDKKPKAKAKKAPRSSAKKAPRKKAPKAKDTTPAKGSRAPTEHFDVVLLDDDGSFKHRRMTERELLFQEAQKH